MKIACVVGFCLCVFVLSLQAGQPTGNDAERQRRKFERAARENVAKGYADAQRSALNPSLNSLAGTVKWLASLSAKADGQKILGEVRSADSQYANLNDLDKLIDGIAQPKDLDERQRKDLEARLRAAHKQRADSLLSLARICYDAGLLGYAYDQAWTCLGADPDNAAVRAAMGQVKVGSEWVSRWAATQMQQGNVYLPGAGWVPKTAAESVKTNQWVENGRVLSMAEADKLHANPATPWVIETENFTLKSTATRKQAMQMAERLEAIRSLCFREYLEFFLRGSKQKGAQLLFSAPAAKKLLVNYYGRKEDFVSAVQGLSGMRDKEILLRSAGFFSHQDHASFFYYDAAFGSFQVTVMQHEVTHQILGEYAVGGIAPTWLVEGAAKVLEDGKPGPDGRLVLPHGARHPDVIAAVRLLKENKLPSAAQLLNMSHDTFHQPAVRMTNYTTSGALFRCLLDMGNGVYAADVLEYLHDAYRGKTTQLSDYIDMDEATIEKTFRSYLEAAGATKTALPVRSEPNQPAVAGKSFGGNAGTGATGPFVARGED